jgi:hypothetical protein
MLPLRAPTVSGYYPVEGMSMVLILHESEMEPSYDYTGAGGPTSGPRMLYR